MPPTSGRTTPLRAFTLVEIMVVVVIIGLLASIAIASVQRVHERSLASRLANDFRQFDAAFQRYAMVNGGWPPPGAPGVMPVGMAGYLPDTYTQPTAIGGNFSWSGPAAKLYLLNCPPADIVMQRVDALLDDGNLATGDFQKISNGYVSLLK